MSGAATSPRVAVFGAGAVGAWFGGLLARAGVPVALVARPSHVAAIRRDGLRLESAAFDERVPVAAVGDDPALVAGADLVLVCVKSSDTEAAADAIAPHLAPGARVLSLQNGVDNAARLRQRLAAHGSAAASGTWPAVVYVATGMAGPGHVKHHGRGELVIGPLPGDPAAPPGVRLSTEAVVALFARAGVPVQVSDQVLGALWAKLVLNCAWNALSAIARRPYGELTARPGVPQVMRDVIDECRAVARAAGVALPEDVEAGVARIATTMPGQFSSTAQDLMAGKPTEIDHLNGFVAREGERLGVPVPVNRTLWTLVRLVEGR